MLRRDHRRVRIMRLLTLGGLGAALFAAVGSPSSADVTAVSGSAYGASGSVSLFGGPPIVLAPTPTVTLPATGEAQNGSVPSILFEAGPADLLTTGAVDVSTQGTLGAGGAVTSTATVRDVVIGGTMITTLSSTCTANESGVSGSTTVTGGRVPTGDTDRATEGDEVYTDVPATPPVGATLNGLVPSVATDYYRVVFNEQIVSGNTITVNAAHFYLGEPAAGQNPVATGEVILGQVVCGVTATGVTTTQPGGVTTTEPPGVTTTQPPGVTTTQPPGVTTTQPPGVTTTQPPGATTTTRPGGTTTTTRAGATTTTVRATTTVPVSVATTVPPSQPGKSLVRTGSTTQSLIVLAFLTMVLGALALIGLSSRPVSAGPASGPWTGLVRRAAEHRRRRRPWNRRSWS